MSEQHPQALGSHTNLQQWWVFKQHRFSYANKAFWDFRHCVLWICLCQEHCSQLPLTAWGGDKDCPVGAGALTHHCTYIDIITAPRVIFQT